MRVGVVHVCGLFLKWWDGRGGMREGLFVHVRGFSFSGVGGGWWEGVYWYVGGGGLSVFGVA